MFFQREVIFDFRLKGFIFQAGKGRFMRKWSTFLLLNFLIFHLGCLSIQVGLRHFLIFLIRVVISSFFLLLFWFGFPFQLGLSKHLPSLPLNLNLEIGFWKVIFFWLFLSFLSRGRKSDVLVRVLKESLDEDGVFFLDVFIDTGLIFFRDTGNDILDGVSVFFHLLMMTSTLTRISGNYHVWHHFIDPGVFLELRILEHLLEVAQEDCILESFLFIPMPITLVFGKLSEGRLYDLKGKTFIY